MCVCMGGGGGGGGGGGALNWNMSVCSVNRSISRRRKFIGSHPSPPLPIPLPPTSASRRDTTHRTALISWFVAFLPFQTDLANQFFSHSRNFRGRDWERGNLEKDQDVSATPPELSRGESKNLSRLYGSRSPDFLESVKEGGGGVKKRGDRCVCVRGWRLGLMADADCEMNNLITGQEKKGRGDKYESKGEI